QQPRHHPPDIFSAGVLLYEMATGRRAFAAETPAQIAAAITGRQPPHPRKINPRLPAGVGRIIVRALEKDPDRRYQSAAELYEDLRRARANAALLGRLPPRLRSRRSLAIAGIAVAALVAAGGAPRTEHGPREPHRQRHGRSGLRRHAARSGYGLPGAVSLSRSRV